MSLTVVFRETTLRNLARIRSEDKDLFVRTRRAVALLTDQPYPEGPYLEGAVPWAPLASTGYTQATSGFCTKSMTKLQRCMSSTSQSSPDLSAP